MTARLRQASLALLTALCWLAAVCWGDAPAAPEVAVVTSLAGTVTVSMPPSTEKRMLQAFDWLPAGSVIEAGTDARLILALVNGHRYEFADGAKATLSESGLVSSSGKVQALDPVSPLPDLSPIAGDQTSGLNAGVFRFRSGMGGPVTGGQPAIEVLFPGHAAIVSQYSVTLGFRPQPEARRYKVEVEDEKDKIVFATETEQSELTLPEGLLRPDTVYSWRVETLDRGGEQAHGAAQFLTLRQADAQARQALKKSVDKLGDAASLALLAEVDRRLGLRREARAELRAAVEMSGGDPALRRALERLELSGH